MSKVLGLDYGTKRIGVAVSDESRTLAREIGTWPAGAFFEHLKSFLGADPEVTGIVVGLPLNMDGGSTRKTEEAREFAARVGDESGLPTKLADERLSSAMARSLPGGSTGTDSLAAQIILQNYLDRNKQNE